MDDTIWDMPYHVILRAWLPVIKNAVAALENANGRLEAQDATRRLNRIAWGVARDMEVYDELY